MRTAYDPKRLAAQRELAALTRRRAYPSWLTSGRVLFAAAVLAFWSYVVVYSFDAAFLDGFGASPEDVGISEQVLIVRAAVTAVAVLSVASGFVVVFGLCVWGVTSILRSAERDARERDGPCGPGRVRAGSAATSSGSASGRPGRSGGSSGATWSPRPPWQRWRPPRSSTSPGVTDSVANSWLQRRCFWSWPFPVRCW